MFLAMNRNKLGMTLDPGSPKGREITKKLVATAGKGAPKEPTYTGLDVCTPETAATCIAK